eukprot:CAMPEP_0175020908 /NCGR_PEP_ID=MMETSP0005-20121125/14405_1 /TAXON_ID=420556 /ORGANISM="Ochromonas sp., Strain CCMP1393" /LENGTH=301 /DNA_ID=CAMNT_0016278867 /DNA_START=1 /DNA_END=907 /DNA_ORIENTATION=+
MAIKLLAARVVKTRYYLTLDADVVLLRPFELSNILPLTVEAAPFTDAKEEIDGKHIKSHSVTQETQEEDSYLRSASYRALYHFEERSVHANWWEGSEQMLDVDAGTSWDINSGNNIQSQIQGFGVTPAILSTYGSLLTVAHLCDTISRTLPLPTSTDPDPTPNTPGSTAGESSRSKSKSKSKSKSRSLADTHPGLYFAYCEKWWLDGLGKPGYYSWQKDKYNTAGADSEGAASTNTNTNSNANIMIWSEYTLYRITLDHYELFDELHTNEALVPHQQTDTGIVAADGLLATTTTTNTNTLP